MSYPTKYSRQYDFQSYQNSNPTRPLPGDKVNVDLNYVVTSVSEIIEFQKLIQNSDGTPKTAATVSVGTVTGGAAGTSPSVTNSGTSFAAVLDFVIPKGDTGAKGDTGDAATISVGTVTTGTAGSSASVTNSGTSGAAVLDFDIPQGAKGDTGDAATVSVGTVTTGAAGSSATVTNSGTSVAVVLDFSIPRGNTGSAATVSVGTVTTGAAGSSAIVTNSGTSDAAVFDFSIPKGDTGAAGPLAADVSTEDIATTTYTVVTADLGKRKRTTSASAVTITLPNSMEQGFSFLLCQTGAGQVTFSAATGATLNNRASNTKTFGQWSEVSLTVDSNSDGSSAVWVLSGDTAP